MTFDYSITSEQENAFAISASYSSTAGGVGNSQDTLGFHITKGKITLQSFKNTEFHRNVLVSRTVVLDFVNNTLTVDYENGSDETQKAFGQNLEPGGGISVDVSTPNLTRPSFAETNRWRLLEMIQQLRAQHDIAQ